MIANILDFLSVNKNNANVNDVIVDAGGELNLSCEQYIPIDKQPLKSDYAFIVEDSGTGNFVVLGYIDPINENEAKAGEEGLKGRSGNGKVVCRIFCKNDGTVILNNDNGSFLLNPNGDFNINGVTIDTAGNIITPAKVEASSIIGGGKELVEHTHPAGTPPGNTGVNN